MNPRVPRLFTIFPTQLSIKQATTSIAMASETAERRRGYAWTQLEVNNNPVEKLSRRKTANLEKYLNLPGFKRVGMSNMPVMSASANSYAILALDGMRSPGEPEPKQDKITDRVKQVFEVALDALSHLEAEDRYLLKPKYLTNVYISEIHKRLVRADPSHWRELHWRVNNVRSVLQCYGLCLDLSHEARNLSRCTHSIHQCWLAAKAWSEQISLEVPAPAEGRPRGDKLEDHNDGRDDLASLLEKRNNERYLGVGRPYPLKRAVRYDIPQDEMQGPGDEQSNNFSSISIDHAEPDPDSAMTDQPHVSMLTERPKTNKI